MNVVKDAPVYKTMFVNRKDVVTLLERIFTAYNLSERESPRLKPWDESVLSQGVNY